MINSYVPMILRVLSYRRRRTTGSRVANVTHKILRVMQACREQTGECSITIFKGALSAYKSIIWLRTHKLVKTGCKRLKLY